MMITAAVLLTACSGGGTAPQQIANAIATQTKSRDVLQNSPGYHYLYGIGCCTDGNSQTTISVFSLPVTKTSTPIATTLLPDGQEVGEAATDAEHLFVSTGDGYLYVYDLPLTTGQSPSVQDMSQAFFDNGMAAADRTLFVSDTNPIDAFPLPYHTGESPSASLYVDSGGISADRQFLHVLGDNGLQSYALPLVKGESPTASISLTGTHAITQNETSLFVESDGPPQPTFITQYSLPLTNASTGTAYRETLFTQAMAANSKNLFMAASHGIRVVELPLSSGRFFSLHIANCCQAVVLSH